jgi:hypothetical protein
MGEFVRWSEGGRGRRKKRVVNTDYNTKHTTNNTKKSFWVIFKKCVSTSKLTGGSLAGWTGMNVDSG